MMYRCTAGGRSRRGAVAQSTALVLLASATIADATPPSYEISVGVGQTDNVRRVPTNAESEGIGTTGLELDWHELRQHLTADVTTSLDYLEYFDNTYSSELIGNFAGQMRARFAPDRFEWVLADNFGQGRVNALAAVTPDNRENINYFTTGPDFGVSLGATTRLKLNGRYSKVTYEINPFDNERYSGAIGLERELSSASRASINVSSESVSFDEAIFTEDYDRQEAFLRYDLSGSRTTFATDVGYTKLKLDSGSSDGAVARVQLSRQVSSSSILAAAVGHEYSDAGSSFRLTQTLGGTGVQTQPTLQTSDPFTNDYVSLAWNFERRRTGFGLNVARYDESYRVNTTLDRKRTQGTAFIRRNLRPTLQASLQATYSDENFENLVGDAREIGASAQIAWNVGRSLSLSVQYDYTDRQSDIAASEFRENRVWLRLGYGRRAVASAGPVAPPLPSDTGY